MRDGRNRLFLMLVHSNGVLTRIQALVRVGVVKEWEWSKKASYNMSSSRILNMAEEYHENGDDSDDDNYDDNSNNNSTNFIFMCILDSQDLLISNMPLPTTRYSTLYPNVMNIHH